MNEHNHQVGTVATASEVEKPSIFQRVKTYFSGVGDKIVSAFKNLSRSPLNVVLDNVSDSARAKVGFFGSILLFGVGFLVASRVLRR